jgi:hypothetical protein
MGQIRRILNVGGSSAILVRRKLAEFYGWIPGAVVDIDINSERIIVTRLTGVTVSKASKIVRINSKELG